MEGITMKGRVDSFLVSPDGGRTLVQPGSNTVSYACADVVAELFAGRGGGPDKIMFAYSTSAGQESKFSFTTGTRAQKRKDIVKSGLSVSGVPIDANPALAPSAAGGAYAGNVVQLRATMMAPTGDDVYVYGYLLEDAEGRVLATRKLSSGLLKPAGYGLAVTWSITFL